MSDQDSRISADPTRHVLASTLGNLAVQMRELRDSESVLEVLATAAVDIVPGARWACISLVAGRKVRSHAPTDEVSARLDQMQVDLGEGPAFDVLRERRTVHVEDLAAESRWPHFSRGAVEFGVRSMLSFRLFISNESLGVLNLYSDTPHVFTDESLAAGKILAQHAAVAMKGVATEEQLQGAVASRDVIGQAKGILMNRDNLTGLQAFATLIRASQETNVRLADVARLLVSDHEAAVACD
jgi:GAF domain-containing protein